MPPSRPAPPSVSDTHEVMATLAWRQDLTEDLCVCRFVPEGGAAIDFEPGQYTTLAMPDTDVEPPRLIRRAYSIASPPSTTDHLEFYLALVREGRLTPRIWGMAVGDWLYMGTVAHGRFTIADLPRDKDLVMVATGTGLAPYMSMLRQYRGTDHWRRAIVMHGVRYAADLGYRDELEQMAREDPMITYIPTVTREPADSSWTGCRGRVPTLLEPETFERLVGLALDPEQCFVLLCGNPQMITDTRRLLEARGFVSAAHGMPGNILYERYW